MVQVFFVMLFFPVIMNALQYYIIDGFIKDQKPADHEPIPSDDSDEDDEEDTRRSWRQNSRSGPREDQYYGSENEDTIKNGETVKAAEVSDKADLPDRIVKLKANPKKLDEYDPATDGSSSGSSPRGRRESTSPPKDVDADGKKI